MFADRRDAGQRLGARLRDMALDRPVVLGLPRGGVPVAREVAASLAAPLDVIVVRKIGVPGQAEVGMGAVAEDGIVVWNDDIRAQLALPAIALDASVATARAALDERVGRIRAAHPQLPVRGRTAVIVDDGVATGIDARAACRCARARGAARVVLAVPVAPTEWTSRLAGEADALVAVETDADFTAVGSYYDDFGQTSDDEVLACLAPPR